jgi:dTDP-4-amino-4,6-dideoxygalactose transaminase
MGNPCQMDKIMEIAKKHDLIILEDCCEALGSTWAGEKVGNFGLSSSFSFFFSHHLTTMEGGMIACQDPAMADRFRILRAHGWLRNVDAAVYNLDGYDLDPRYAFVNWGFNVRPTEVQASFGLHQLQKLPGFNQRRAELADKFFAYIDRSEHLSRPEVHAEAEPAWFALPILRRDNAPFSTRELRAYLEQKGVETRPIVTGNIAKQPAAALFEGLADCDYPGADIIHSQGFYVGLSPMQNVESIDRLIECFEGFFEQYR